MKWKKFQVEVCPDNYVSFMWKIRITNSHYNSNGGLAKYAALGVVLWESIQEGMG